MFALLIFDLTSENVEALAWQAAAAFKGSQMKETAALAWGGVLSCFKRPLLGTKSRALWFGMMHNGNGREQSNFSDVEMRQRLVGMLFYLKVKCLIFSFNITAPNCSPTVCIAFCFAVSAESQRFFSQIRQTYK